MANLLGDGRKNNSNQYLIQLLASSSAPQTAETPAKNDVEEVRGGGETTSSAALASTGAETAAAIMTATAVGSGSAATDGMTTTKQLPTALALKDASSRPWDDPLICCRCGGSTGCDLVIRHRHDDPPSHLGGGEKGSLSSSAPDGCRLHARCCPPPPPAGSGASSSTPYPSGCPFCSRLVRSVQLVPMNFDGLDRARSSAQLRRGGDAPQQRHQSKRSIGDSEQMDDSDNKKRKERTSLSLGDTSDDGNAGRDVSSSTMLELASSLSSSSSELRTGRWSSEETLYCDSLILLFERGKLPIPDGLKLNDFLSGMLRSKQARLTKKMKNAKLSSRQYRRTTGYIDSADDAVQFSHLESNFLQSIRCDVEREELRFAMQREWRELFSTYSANLGMKLDADLWLSSVEEMDRRASQQKDAARMQRRKEMMGYALSHDHQNPQRGVFIEPPPTSSSSLSRSAATGLNAMMIEPLAVHHPQQHPSERPPFDPNSSVDKRGKVQRASSTGSPSGAVARPKAQFRPLSSYPSPFIGKAVQLVQRRNMPFEHIDAWVPSQVPKPDGGVVTRLCFAGCGTAEVRVPETGIGPAQPMSIDDQFDLISFGLYSQKFSFDVGCGLPGRVYESGVPSWEQGIANAPPHLFERCAGARQWGIQTVLGLPIFSPNVGRIVILFYSYFDRPRDDGLVARMINELTKMMPSPKWKLVVDVGLPSETATSSDDDDSDERQVLTRELLSLLHHHTPLDKSSPLAEFLPGFSSLRLLLSSDFSESRREQALLEAALGFFRKYRTMGIAEKDAVWMTARDFMTVSKHSSTSDIVPVAEEIQQGPSSRVTLTTQMVQSRFQRLPHQEACQHSTSFIVDGDAIRSNGALSSGEHSSMISPSSLSGLSFGDPATDRRTAKIAPHTNTTGRPRSEGSQVHQNMHLSSLQGIEGNDFAAATGVVDLLPFGLSPALYPIVASDVNPESIPNLALGFSTSQLAALLQSDNVDPRQCSDSQ